MHAAFILDKTLGYPELRYIMQSLLFRIVKYLPGEESAVHTYQSHLLVLKPCKCIIKKGQIVCACRSVAWAQPEVRYHPYFRNEGRERMVRQPSGTFGIVSLGRSFLVALTTHYRRVKVQGVIVKHQIRE